MVVTIIINMFGAGVYGEAEFIFAWVLSQVLSTGYRAKASISSVKVITITGLIILGIVLDLGGMSTPEYLFWDAKIKQVGLIMIESDSDTGKTLDHSFNFLALRALQVAS